MSGGPRDHHTVADGHFFRVELHCQYCSTLILLYRTRIKTDRSRKPGSALDICVRAAEQLNDLIRFLKDRYGVVSNAAYTALQAVLTVVAQGVASSQITFWAFAGACVHVRIMLRPSTARLTWL